MNANTRTHDRRTESEHADSPDVVFGTWPEHRAPPDPAGWNTIYNHVTGEPCPKCGVALGVVFGVDLEAFAIAFMADYDVTVPEGFTDGYDTPVYLYCDAPVCDYQAVAEWRDIRVALGSWMHGDAPTWRECVATAREEVTCR